MSDLNTSVYDPLEEIMNSAKTHGIVNAHTHADRAFTLNRANFFESSQTLQEKWRIVQKIQKERSVYDIYKSISMVCDLMIHQGVRQLCTFIDVDPFVGEKSMQAARMARERYGGEIKILLANQVLSGVIEEEAYQLFRVGAEFCDIVGGLPEKDKGREEEHLDIVLGVAKELGKMAHVHIDQGKPRDKGLELLAKKTIEHEMQGRVVGIHSISIASHPKKYREFVYKEVKKAGIKIITCPLAWIDRRREETLAPIHNSITPIDEMLEYGIEVAIGTDNIRDIYLPYGNGSIREEIETLCRVCRISDPKDIVPILTVNGQKALGINKLEQ